jgi:hypothetical protein
MDLTFTGLFPYFLILPASPGALLAFTCTIKYVDGSEGFYHSGVVRRS